MTILADGETITEPEPAAADEPCAECDEQNDDEHFGSTSTSVTDAAWDGSASRFTDEQYQRATAACDQGDGTVKTRCVLPHHEPDGRTNRNGVHAAAQRAGQVKGHDAATVSRAKAHLRSHYRQLGEDPPSSIAASAAVIPELGALMAASEADPQPVPGWAAGESSFISAATEAGEHTDARALVASALVRLGSPFGVAQDGSAWHVITAAGEVPWTESSYAEAVGRIAEQLAQGDARPVLAERWRSNMAFEGVDTGDGRYIRAGGIAFRDCPLPLMLQTETAGGHMGAVLAGTIEQAGKVGATAVGQGCFDDSEAGRQFAQIIEARGRFGVSIDVAEAEGEFVCTERDGDGDCTDGRVEFDLVKVMGVTGTPFPAFADAYIELDDQASQVAASAAPQAEPVIEAERTLTLSAVAPVLAAGGPATPPLAWFDNPGFHVGDDRLVRQPNGGYACPLTITPEGRVFGHLAPADSVSWGLTGRTAGRTCHTGYQGRCVPPPRSASNYAAFMLRPLMTAEGDVVHVGHVTMGCGHLYREAPAEEVRAHYDGGPGAVRVASVSAGEDDFGVWIAGSLAEGLTDAQVRAFCACSLSGDWREVWSGKGLDLVACLAGVPAPGYPVAALAAAAVGEDGTLMIGDMFARWRGGHLVALVASSVVRQPEPWERAAAATEARVEALEARLAAAERVTAPLRSLAAEALVASVEIPAS